LNGAMMFSKIDLRSRYHQLRIKKNKAYRKLPLGPVTGIMNF
jgi:hypothetical protein